MSDNPKVLELQARIGEIDAEFRTMHDTAGDEPFTAEQDAQWTGLEEQRAAAEKELADLNKRLARVASLATQPEHRESGDGVTGAPKSPEFMRKVEPFDGADVRSLAPRQARDKALKALDVPELTEHLEDRQKAHLNQVLRKWSRNCNGSEIARRLLLTENEHYRSAFVKMVTETHPVLEPEEARALRAFNEYRAMSIGTDSAGGFGVPVLIDPTIILTAQGSPNDILALSRVEVITNDEWKGVTSAGATWSFDAEAAEVSDDSPTIAQPNVPVHKAQGFIPYSIEVGMDYPNFAGEMSMLLDEGFRELVAEKLTTGSGTNEPTGIVTALDANTNVEVTPTTDGAFGAVDLYKLWDALPIKYRNRGDRVAWMSSTDVQNEVRNFGTTLGSNFTVDLTDESIPRLFGRRYYLNDFMADFTGTTGASNLLIVGDWQNYLVAQRAGMSVELVPHLLHTSNNRPSGQRGWYAWARLGGDSINDLGFRILQNQ
jgi:HK97 family phage major capsid protein